MKIMMNMSRASGLRRPSQRLGRPKASRKLAAFRVESLETRQMLTVAVVGTPAIPAAYFTPTTTNLADAQNGPLANLGSGLVSVYQSYATDFAASVAAGNASPAAATALASKIASQYPAMQFANGLVDMDINSLGGDFNSFVTKLTSLGMVITASSSAYGIAEGWVPIAELPTIARLPQTEAGHAIPVAIKHALQGGFQGYQGQAYNQPETSLGADSVRATTGLTGAGVTIGVISDSVNQVRGGLSESYGTGDLDPNNPVKVIQDGNSSNSDEGRAMLESIHDIAPGANLQFASSGGSLQFMQNIEALYNAGSKVIVDDISEGDEPFFQDGLISQGVDYVTARGATYFSSAGNGGTDSGYLSSFRPVVTTVNGMDSTWDNFNPTGGTAAANALLPITASKGNINIQLLFGQAYKTQEPTGATASVTSVLDFYVFDSGGKIVASGTDNNVATQESVQNVSVPSAGNYFVAIKLVSGAAPGHVEFIGSEGALAVSQEYGSAGGTYYPDAYGHEVAAATIGVGATPWYATTPFIGQTPLQSEPFSSSGPGLIDLSPKGTAITSQIIQSPQITAPDAGSNTACQGGPKAGVDTTGFGSAFNLNPTGQANFNSFYGTSQAVPNAAAVAALMLQQSPSLTRVQILQVMENTATAMNGTPKGSDNVQSGYGLVNAGAAINAIAPSSLAASTVAASSSTSTPTVNQPFTLSARVAGTKGTPTGSVDFYDISYNTDLGSIGLASGMASLTNDPTVAGAHVFLLTYSGSSSTAPSTAYLVLNVEMASQVVTGHSFAARPIALPSGGAVSIPLSIDSQLIDDVAVGIISPATSQGSTPTKKRPLGSVLSTSLS